MNKTTIGYYRAAVNAALNARESIAAANEEYVHRSALAKSNLEDGILGEVGFRERIESLKLERDVKIENALNSIDAVSGEYAEEMARLCRLDGNRIDDGAMKLLNSGIALTVQEWQELADMHKDNYVMTKILQQRYEGTKPEGELSLQFIRFGQNPMERAEIFGRFAETIRNECTLAHTPSLAGGGIFASRADYFNFLAKGSIEKMQPFEDEDFSSLDADFPVEMAGNRWEGTGNGEPDSGSGDSSFSFGFTPIRQAKK